MGKVYRAGKEKLTGLRGFLRLQHGHHILLEKIPFLLFML